MLLLSIAILTGLLNANLNDNQYWQWSFEACGSQNKLGTGDTLYFNPFFSNTFYVRGEGGCINSPNCAEYIFTALDCDSSLQVNGLNIFTAFSPNNDGVNDTWIIDSIPQNTSVIIYNRWGDMIKKIENYNNLDNVWDGKSILDEKVSSGTYFYIIEKNNLKISSGWVEVVR
jgi:gliding motility-associated-like protein